MPTTKALNLSRNIVSWKMLGQCFAFFTFCDQLVENVGPMFRFFHLLINLSCNKDVLRKIESTDLRMLVHKSASSRKVQINEIEWQRRIFCPLKWKPKT